MAIAHTASPVARHRTQVTPWSCTANRTPLSTKSTERVASNARRLFRRLQRLSAENGAKRRLYASFQVLDPPASRLRIRQSYPFNRYCPAQFQAALKWCGQYRLSGRDRMELLPVTSTFPSLRTCATHPSLQHESYSLRACWRAEVGDASKRSDSCGSVRCHMLSMVGPTAAPKLWCLEGGMV